MTGNAFLPGLFIFQILEIAAAVFFSWRGYYWLAGGCILLLIAFTLPVRGAYSLDPKMEVNSDILTILSGYHILLMEMSSKVRCGQASEEEYQSLKAEVAEFKKKIEIDPDDDRCIYRWKKK
jgi:hypothetical protein